MKFKGVAALAVIAVVLAGCAKGDDNAQARSQAQTEEYTQAATNAVPYPSAAMTKGGWLERRLLKENLLRQNNADRIAYVTLLNQQGQPIVQYTIQGMVVSLNSQMTTEDTIGRYCNEGNCDRISTKAAGDNGTWGPEPEGITFFTTEGVQVKWNGLYLEADSPIDLTTKPLIVYDASTAKAPDTASGVKSKADGGISTGG